MSFYHTWKNVRQQCKNNEIKIIAPTGNDEFKLPNGSYSVSDIQDYIKYVIKKHEAFTTIPPVNVYLNKINKRLVFEIKVGYKLELEMSETKKVFGSTKTLIGKTKKRENVRGLEAVELVLVQCNSVDNQYQQKYEESYISTPNKSYTYLLNIEPSNLAVLKTYNTQFDDIFVKFTN